MKLRFCLMLLALIALLGSGSMPALSQAQDLVNLAHLRFLTEPVTIEGRPMALVHIYSEAPTYTWVDAAGEGISAIDDVARAAVVYLWQYERLKQGPDAADALQQARLCLEFVRYMQAPDGAFYNFVLNRDGKINTTGNTSYKSLDWWAMRALWALGEGVRVFASVDATYADTLAKSYLLTESAIAKNLTNYGQYTTLHGFKIPAWLPNGAADSSAVGVLGMVAYQRAHPNPATADLITKIAEGIAAYQLGSDQAYPFGMHPVSASAPGYWHDWGAHMGHALVEAGMVLKRQDWIDSAAKEANSFLLRQLVLERFRDIGMVPNRLGQIAYGTNMLVQTYMALYRATGDEKYARYGGLAASWYFGNNMAGVTMYDPATGRVFDGINGPVEWRVNRNAGAESTIEGLLSMLAVVDVPQAMRYLHAQATSGTSYRVLEAEDGKRLNGQPTYYTGDWMGDSFISQGRYVGLSDGQEMELTLNIPANDNYFLYVAHLRQVEKKRDETATALRLSTPPSIDGKLDEWGAIPAIASNTREQFLRGAGFWKGPDVDSHSVQIAWDDQNLYLAVQVQAPAHVQTYTLSNVWHGEATWIYLTDDLTRRSLSAKFTLAQTPDGPQVWDWLNSGFLKGAKMVWAKTDNGFRYEASIPWASVGIRAPKAGQIIGIEAGRGIGGNSFMDLTGRDPDVGSNLLPVRLTDFEGAATRQPQDQTPLYLRMQIGDEKPMLVPVSVAPDRSYWWLDRVTRVPLQLPKGDYPLRYACTGASGDVQCKVDAFYLQPSTARRGFTLPDGGQITLTYDTTTGESTWIEK